MATAVLCLATKLLQRPRSGECLRPHLTAAVAPLQDIGLLDAEQGVAVLNADRAPGALVTWRAVGI